MTVNAKRFLCPLLKTFFAFCAGLLYLDSNNLQGNMNMICDRPKTSRIPILVADCGGAPPEVQ
jgi:hypothetical protein